MRVVTFKKDKSGHRIGIIYGDRIANLRAAFEMALMEEKGIPTERAKDDTSQQIPDSIIDLISRGDDGIRCIKRAYEFLNRSDEKRLSAACSPSGDRIIYEKEEVQILKPLEVFRP
jgi:hypothetical protein